MSLPKRSTYVLHAGIGLLLLVLAAGLDSENRESFFVSLVTAVFNIGGLIILLGSLYKVIWYKKYTTGLQKHRMDK